MSNGLKRQIPNKGNNEASLINIDTPETIQSYRAFGDHNLAPASIFEAAML